MDIPILFADEDILVIAKPAGVVVNRASSVRGETIQDWFDAWSAQNPSQLTTKDWINQIPEEFSDEYGSPEEIFAERLGMVHRIDKNTSGVLVLARNPGSLVNLLMQFRTRKVTKQYLCLVHGKIQTQRDTIQAPLGRASGADRKKFQVRADGREASTEYQVLEYWPQLSSALQSANSGHPSYQQGFTLVKAIPHTGRTHQIRVHFSHLGHPLVGDSTYLGKKRAKLDISWCPRHFLHAWQISFTHPRTGEQLTLQAPLPEDLQLVLRNGFEYNLD